MTTTIAIAGISSKLALLVARELLKRPDVYIRGSCRDINKLPSDLQTSSRVSLFQSEPYDTETLGKMVDGCEVVVCCYFASNEIMLEGQKLLIDLCEEKGITRYIVSDYTADCRNFDWCDMAIKEPMKHVKAYLDTKPTVNGVHVLVGVFIETFLDFFDVWDPETKVIGYWGTGDEKWDLTSYQTGAEYVAAVALDPTATGFLKFRGERISSLEVAKQIGSVYEIEPILERKGSLTELAKGLDTVGNAEKVLAAGTYFVLSGKISLGEKVDNARYPSVKPETFSQIVLRNSKEN